MKGDLHIVSSFWQPVIYLAPIVWCPGSDLSNFSKCFLAFFILIKVAADAANKKINILLSYVNWKRGLLWSWMYNYLCNQCLSPHTLWVRIPLRRVVLYTTLCDKVCQWLATDLWFSPVSSTNKIDCHDITEILLKVTLNTITLTPIKWKWYRLKWN